MFVALTAVLTLAAVQDPTPLTGVDVQGERVLTAEERRAAEEEARQNEVICRREHVVGSNRPQRICQTRRQWEHLSETSRDALRDDRFQTGQGRGPGEAMGG
ncbi:hypothetical protein [Brevundimonas sp.]|uniref:hypothetical protein n=1 Tax=Brevundimonas sp. TaxID=1871086 RepID=UPI0025FE40B4|nr:hypothetical protein [Brevundimonas sp.]